jgi:hypothetical protein
MQIMARLFYEFHSYRVVSRAGQPILVKENVELGPIISREDAVRQAKSGKDIYTFLRRDAEKLAVQLYHADPSYDPPHQPSYFQHFHPGDEHPDIPRDRQGRPRAEVGPGHVFFGSRGENYVAKHREKSPR